MAVTSAKSWRSARVEGVEITLPSGKTVKIRPIDIGAFAKVGYIPEVLKPVVIKVLNEGVAQVGPIEEYENALDWFKFLDSLTEYCFVDPKIDNDCSYWEEKDIPDNVLSVADVSTLDKLFLFKYFGRPAEELLSFRDGQEEFVKPVESETNNGDSNKSISES